MRFPSRDGLEEAVKRVLYTQADGERGVLSVEVGKASMMEGRQDYF